MRKTTYSTQFQLCEQRGSFAGIDTFSMTDFQNMEITSTLLAHYESLSIVHRKYINSLLTKLVKDKKIGKCIANLRREEANYVVNKMGINIDESNFGATYVPIDAIMRYVKRQSTSEIGCQAQIPGDGENNNTISIRFTPIWPVYLYPCQQMDVYGAKFPPIPPLTVKKTDRQEIDSSVLMCLWDTIALLGRVKKIWDIVVEHADFCSTKWEGLILNFVSRRCFNNLVLGGVE